MQHLVDLSSGAPKCGCEDFHFRKTCDHIHFAREYQLRAIGRHFKGQFHGKELRYVSEGIYKKAIRAAAQSAVGPRRPTDPFK